MGVQACGAPHSGQNLLGLSRRALQRGQVAAWAAPHAGQKREPAGTGLAQARHAPVAAAAPAAGDASPARAAWPIACVMAWPIATPAPRPAPAPATPPSLAAATGIDCAVWNCV